VARTAPQAQRGRRPGPRLLRVHVHGAGDGLAAPPAGGRGGRAARRGNRHRPLPAPARGAQPRQGDRLSAVCAAGFSGTTRSSCCSASRCASARSWASRRRRCSRACVRRCRTRRDRWRRRGVPMRYCGRDFGDDELARIRVHAAAPGATRRAISRRVCEELGWRKPDGGLKEMSCRVALLRMQHDGLVQLPAPLHRSSNTARTTARTTAAEPGSPPSPSRTRRFSRAPIPSSSRACCATARTASGCRCSSTRTSTASAAST